MATVIDDTLRQQLTGRRERLEAAMAVSADRRDLERLLQEVDAALDRFESGTYGL